MNRLIISTIGVILTFICIVYTAPPRQDKLEKFENEPIKKINKSGSTSPHRIKQPVYKSIQTDTSIETLMLTQFSTERNYEME